jgi:hypothetical protein
MLFIQVIAIVFSVSIFIGIVDLIRRGRLKEQYAILWLVSAAILLVLSSWRGLLHKLSRFVGVEYPPALLFLLAFLFLLVIVLHYSVVISKLSEKNKRLAQEIALLKTMLEEWKGKKGNQY